MKYEINEHTDSLMVSDYHCPWIPATPDEYKCITSFLKKRKMNRNKHTDQDDYRATNYIVMFCSVNESTHQTKHNHELTVAYCELQLI